MHDVLVTLFWLTAAAIVVTVVGYVGLRWAVLRIATRVANRVEGHLAASFERGMRGSRPFRRPERPDMDARYLAQVERLAWLMDRVIPLPVIGGIGLDAVLGLIPVAGDVVSLGVSALIVVRAT